MPIVGECSGKFDIIMDFVRTERSKRFYNTHIFSGNKNWVYENRNRRAAYGYPKLISTVWRGLPNNLDTYVHYAAYNRSLGKVADHYFYFKGIEKLSAAICFFGLHVTLTAF